MKKKADFFLLMVLCLLLAVAMMPRTAVAQAGETSVANAYAIQEVKTIDNYFGYTASLGANTNNSKLLRFIPEDWGNLSHMVVAVIRIVEEQSGSPTLYLYVNGSPCTTPSISSVIGRSQYVADFLCTNRINGTGYFNVTFRSTLAVDNIHYRAWLTYVTDLTNQTLASQKQLVEVINYFDSIAEDSLMSNHDYCYSNTTARKLQTVERCGILFNNTLCYTVNRTEDTYCNYGCDTDQGVCREAPYVSTLKVLGGIVAFVVFMLFVLKVSGRI